MYDSVFFNVDPDIRTLLEKHNCELALILDHYTLPGYVKYHIRKIGMPLCYEFLIDMAALQDTSMVRAAMYSEIMKAIDRFETLLREE